MSEGVRTKQIPCPHPRCQKLVDISRDDIAKTVVCPHCRNYLKIEHADFAAEEAVEREARRAAKDEEARCTRQARQAALALAKPQAKAAVALSATAFYRIEVIGGGLHLLACWAGLTPFDRTVWAAAVSVLSIGLAVAVVVLLARLPWYVLSVEAAAQSVAAHRQRQDEAERKQRVQEETKRQAEEKAQRKAQEEQRQREEAKSELQRRLADGGCEECWRNLNWYDFEFAVLLALEKNGYEATPTKKGDAGADGGIDGILRGKEGKTLGVQCKHSGGEYVKVESVRAFRGALSRDGMSSGFFVTVGEYSGKCKEEAAIVSPTSANLKLLGLKDLVEMGKGLNLSHEALAAAKTRWGMPQDPPKDMRPQPRRRSQYRRSRRR